MHKTNNNVIDPKLKNKVKKWLGKSGITFFFNLKKKYGSVSPVYMENGIPHPVHWREGMQVRNFLRKHVNWDCHKLDNQWANIIEEAIK